MTGLVMLSLLVLVCTMIGSVCGAAVAGLLVGVAIVSFVLWALHE